MTARPRSIVLDYSVIDHLCVQLAAHGLGDPNRRVLAMLGARGSYVAATASEEKEVRESA